MKTLTTILLILIVGVGNAQKRTFSDNTGDTAGIHPLRLSDPVIYKPGKVAISPAMSYPSSFIPGDTVKSGNMHAYALVINLPNGAMSYMTMDSVWHMKDTIGTLNALVYYMKQESDGFQTDRNHLLILLYKYQKQIDQLYAIVHKHMPRRKTSYVNAATLQIIGRGKTLHPRIIKPLK